MDEEEWREDLTNTYPKIDIGNYTYEKLPKVTMPTKIIDNPDKYPPIIIVKITNIRTNKFKEYEYDNFNAEIFKNDWDSGYYN